MSRLNLFFPQWQGAGRPGQVQGGANALREQLSHLSFLEIPVAREHTARESGILERPALLAQHQAARDALEREQPKRVFTLGGDCATALAPIAHLNAAQAGLAVLWFDAHGDLNTPASSPSGAFHGMPVRHLLGDGDPDFLTAQPLEPQQLFLLGVRDLDADEAAYLERHPVRRFSVAQLERGSEAVLEALGRGGFGRVAIHLDLDVLEPSEFVANDWPAPGGLSVRGLMRTLEAVTLGLEVVGLSLSVYRPFALEGLPGLRGVLERAW